MRKIIILSLIIATVSVLIYFGLKQEKTFSFSFGPGFIFSNNLSKVGDYFSDFSSVVFEKGKETANSFTSYFKTSELKSKITDNLENLKEKTATNLGELKEKTAATVVKTTGEVLSVNPNSIINGDLLIKSLAYLTKINIPLSFIIKNPFNQTEQKEINYQIEWGDGQKESGDLKEGESTTVSHFWNKEGEYFVRFKIAAGSESFNYQIKILVVK